MSLQAQLLLSVLFHRWNAHFPYAFASKAFLIRFVLQVKCSSSLRLCKYSSSPDGDILAGIGCVSQSVRRFPGSCENVHVEGKSTFVCYCDKNLCNIADGIHDSALLTTGVRMAVALLCLWWVGWVVMFLTSLVFWIHADCLAFVLYWRLLIYIDSVLYNVYIYLAFIHLLSF